MFPVVSTEQTQELMVVDAVAQRQHRPRAAAAATSAWALGAQYRDNDYETHYSDLNNFDVTPCVNSVSTGIVGPGACTPAQLAAPTGGTACSSAAPSNSDLTATSTRSSAS